MEMQRAPHQKLQHMWKSSQALDPNVQNLITKYVAGGFGLWDTE